MLGLHWTYESFDPPFVSQNERFCTLWSVRYALLNSPSLYDLVFVSLSSLRVFCFFVMGLTVITQLWTIARIYDYALARTLVPSAYNAALQADVIFPSSTLPLKIFPPLFQPVVFWLENSWTTSFLRPICHFQVLIPNIHFAGSDIAHPNW